jgi:hypothetical protein
MIFPYGAIIIDEAVNAPVDGLYFSLVDDVYKVLNDPLDAAVNDT